MYTYDNLGTINPATLDSDDYEPHVTFEDAADGTMWGAVVNWMQVGARSEASYMRDPEAIRCHETGYSPKDIYLGKRQYTDDQLGVIDGPMRDRQPLVDTYGWTARTPKAQLTKRQRRKLRKARRAAKRNGIAFNEADYVAVQLIEVR